MNGGRAALKLYKSDVEIAIKLSSEIGAVGLYRGIIPFTLS